MQAHSIMASASSPSPESAAWLRRISTVQRERATPEVLERLRSAADIDRRMSLNAKKAKRIKTSMSLTSAAFHSGMRMAEATPARSSEHRAAMATLSSPAFLSPSSAGPVYRSMIEEEADEEAAEEELAQVAQQQVRAGTLSLADVQTAAEEASSFPSQPTRARLDAVLKQLESEPEDEATCAAKFSLYEGYAKLTEDARSAVTELARTSQADLAAAKADATAAQIAREVAQIDRPDNLGLPDEDPHGRWFVHGMCAAAGKNQRLLDGVLTGIQGKLELLASQTQCPVCFEEFGPSRPHTALACAHKCCSECWGHWSAMARGPAAPCPLCRHEEFLQRVMTAAEPE